MGLGDKTVAMLGTINLSLVLGDKKHNRELYAEFAVVDISFAYNVMIDLPILNYHWIVINMGALRLKLPTPWGLAIIRGS